MAETYEDRGKGRMIADALKILAPGTQWNVRGETVEWNDSSKTEPTQSEIDTQIATNNADWESKEYQRQRAPEYPSVVDQLDEIFHNGIDAWKTKIQETKTKFPKP